MVEVELDIFSGRENPHWKISREKIGEVLRRIAGMKRVPKNPDTINIQRLGYRGFYLKGLGTTVVNGHVAIDDDDEGFCLYEDTNHLEAWLIEEARKRGYGETIEQDLRK